MLNSSKQDAFVLDISDLSIKIAKLGKTAGGLALINYGREEIAPGIIENGEIKQADTLAQIIGKAVESVKGRPLKTFYCVVSLPEMESFIRVIQMPKMQEKEMTEAIKWEMENHIPLSADEVYFDWQLIENGESHGHSSNFINVLVGAVKKGVVDSYLETIKKAGLRPVVFEIESIATVRALVEKNFSASPIMIVDIGARRSSFIIFSGETIHFTSSAPICNEKLVDAIAQKMSISGDNAKKLKFEIGLDMEARGGEVFVAMQPVLAELVEQIKKYIDFYTTHRPPGSQPPPFSKIILCGGGANLSGLANFLQQELKIAVEIGNPWINILDKNPKKLPDIQFGESIGYATAMGLALRGADL